MKKLVMLLIIIMMSSSGVFASGLAIPEQGAAAMGMSAAVTARSEDLSSIFYNPAGIIYVESFEVMLGMTPIRPQHKYTPLQDQQDLFSPANAEKNIFLPPQLYAAYRAADNLVLGIGVFAPFGLGTEWDKTWDGRYTSTFAEIQTVYVNPTMAFQLNEWVTLGFGGSYVTSNAAIEKMVDTGNIAFGSSNTDYDTHFALDGDGTGYTYNLGALIKASETIQLGISYRSAFDIEYEGKAKFTHNEQNIKNAVAGAAMMGGADAATAAAMADGAYATIAAIMPASQDGIATMNMPWMLNLGMKYDKTEKWDISADVNIVGWPVYKELTIDFADDLPEPTYTQKKDWNNSIVVRLGSSYDFTDAIIGRAGIMVDKNPVPDATFDGQLPDSNRIGYSIGAGYKLGTIQFDVSYLLLNFFRREKHNAVGYDTDNTGDGNVNIFDLPSGYPVGNGMYDSRAHLFSASASIRF